MCFPFAYTHTHTHTYIHTKEKKADKIKHRKTSEGVRNSDRNCCDREHWAQLAIGIRLKEGRKYEKCHSCAGVCGDQRPSQHANVHTRSVQIRQRRGGVCFPQLFKRCNLGGGDGPRTQLVLVAGHLKDGITATRPNGVFTALSDSHITDKRKWTVCTVRMWA
jgi:hypothetical protein